MTMHTTTAKLAKLHEKTKQKVKKPWMKCNERDLIASRCEKKKQKSLNFYTTICKVARNIEWWLKNFGFTFCL